MTVATDVAPVTPTPPPPPRLEYAMFEARFAPAPTSVGLSRSTSSALLRQCEVAAPLTEDVVLCISELVTNGITYGAGDVSLRLCYLGNEIRVEVVDSSSVRATMRPAGPDDTSGRGLALVEALSWKWGASEDGRTTWCTFRTPQAGHDDSHGLAR